MLAFIYKIILTEIEFYIGSTWDLKERADQHNHSLHNENCNNYNCKVYKKLREAGVEVIKLEVIYTFECENDDDRRKMEQGYMDELSSTLNDRRAYRSEEDKKTYQKEYWENNKEVLSKYYKLYSENNKEVLSKYHKLYNENNKERIKTRESQRIICECGCEIQKREIARHRKSKKHKKLMLLKS